MVLVLLYGLYSLYDEELMVSISTCDAVLDIKHKGGEGGTGTKTAFTFIQVLHRLSPIPSGISSYFTHEISSVFTISFYTQ